jgi:hypothetical protein
MIYVVTLMGGEEAVGESESESDVGTDWVRLGFLVDDGTSV